MTDKKLKCLDGNDFQAYLDGEISALSRHQFDGHIKKCSRCLEELEAFRSLFAELELELTPGSKDDATEADIADLMRRIGSENALPNSTPSIFPFLRFADYPFVSALVCCAIFIILKFYFTGTSIYRPVTTTKILLEQPSRTDYEFALFAPPNAKLFCVDKSASINSTSGFLEKGLIYKVPSGGKLVISLEENNLEFTKNAGFRVNASAVTVLEGKLFFQQFARRKGWSPIIITPLGTINSLGTSFSVEIEKSFVKVTLEHGKIMLKTKLSERTLVDRGTLFMLPGGEIAEFLNKPMENKTPEVRSPSQDPVNPPDENRSATSTLSTSY